LFAAVEQNEQRKKHKNKAMRKNSKTKPLIQAEVKAAEPEKEVPQIIIPEEHAPLKKRRFLKPSFSAPTLASAPSQEL